MAEYDNSAIMRDVRAAMEVRSMAALGMFPTEITVYGLVYYQNGQRQYMISADIAKLISFLNEPENKKYFPTPIMTYSERLRVPEGYMETVVQSIKVKLARQLQEKYPAVIFQRLAEINDTVPNQAMETDLLSYAKEMECVFETGKVLAFRNLCIKAFLRKNISELVYHQLRQWCDKRQLQLEEFVEPSSVKEKSFYGLAVLKDGGVEKCLINANLKCIYEEQSRLEAEGALTTTWHRYIFQMEQQGSLAGVTQQMKEILAKIYDTKMISLLEKLQQVPSTVEQEAWQKLWDDSQQISSEAASFVLSYGRQWGVAD